MASRSREGAAAWVRSTFCQWDAHPEQYVQFKLVADLVLMAVWLPAMLARASHVYRLTCPPLWTEPLCDEYVARAYKKPLAAFIVAFVLVIAAYTAIYRYLHATLGKRRTAVTSERLYRVYSYFLVFLWLHLYAVAAWAIYVYSLDADVMVPLLLLSMAQDVWVIRRVNTLRELADSGAGPAAGDPADAAGDGHVALKWRAGDSGSRPDDPRLESPGGMQADRRELRQCFRGR